MSASAWPSAFPSHMETRGSVENDPPPSPLIAVSGAFLLLMPKLFTADTIMCQKRSSCGRVPSHLTSPFSNVSIYILQEISSKIPPSNKGVLPLIELHNSGKKKIHKNNIVFPIFTINHLKERSGLSFSWGTSCWQKISSQVLSTI